MKASYDLIALVHLLLDSVAYSDLSILVIDQKNLIIHSIILIDHDKLHLHFPIDRSI